MIKLFTPHLGQQKIIEEFVIGNEDKKYGIITTGR